MTSRSTAALAALAILLLARLARAAPAAGVPAFFPGERDDLIRLRDSLASTLNLHSRWTGPPCLGDRSRWVGLTCARGHVIGVALERVQLTGELPPTAFHNITYLAVLNLRGNALRGPLPGLGGLSRLRAVLLSHNRFSGPIPAGFAELPGLARLELQDNLLDGAIPPFDQPGLVAFDVSYNFLEGRIPGTPTLQGFPASSFDHNLELCGEPLDKPCAVAPPASSAPPSPPQKKWNSKGVTTSAVVLIAVGAAVAVSLFIGLCLLCYCRRRTVQGTRKQGESAAASAEGDAIELRSREAPGSSERMAELEFFHEGRPVFNLDHLLSSSAEVLGMGSLGTTYKVSMESGPVVVKRLKEARGVPTKDFVRQMQLLGKKTRHDNLVEIVSFHCSKEDRLVIREFVPGRSLLELLHDNRGEGRVPLPWAARLDMVKGIARGLAHLHQCLPSHKVPHGDLKASNVIVLHGDGHSGHHPKLTDFGFLPLLPGPSSTGKLAAGKTPEFLQGKKLTHKTDVYCFGLILLEVITGRIPGSEDAEDLAGWVSAVVKAEWSTDVLDLELVGDKGAHGEMLKLAGIALECTAADPGRRPMMSEVLRRVEEINEADDRVILIT